MESDQYDLVFKGDLVPGFELAQVKKNLQVLFRIDASKVDVLFTGKPIPLKKGLPFETANKYRVAMKKAGARVDLIEVAAPTSGQSAATISKASSPNRPTSESTQESKTESDQQYQTALGAQAQKPTEPRKEIVAPEFGLSPSGSNLLKEDEKRKVVAANIDTSQLTVAEQTGRLVDESEIEKLPLLEIDIPDIDVMPAGSDVLKSEERKKHEKVEVDTSGLSVAEAGERLGPERKDAPPAPNVDHIKLAD